MYLLCLAIALLGGAASAQTLKEVNEALAACFLEPIHKMPALTFDQRNDLVNLKVVRVLDRQETGPSGAVGVALLKASRNQLWIAAQDWHAELDAGLIEVIVERYEGDRMLWYGHLDLPSPLKDRQWVVESANNHRMAGLTRGRCWEHVWYLVPDGLLRVRPLVEAEEPNGVTVEMLDNAIFTPVNRGSWFMAPVNDEYVLVAYQATSVVAGFIPDWVVTQLAMSRLEDLLKNLERRALTWSAKHYVTDHPPVYGGDGKAIPTWSGPAPVEPPSENQ